MGIKRAESDPPRIFKRLLGHDVHHIHTLISLTRARLLAKPEISGVGNYILCLQGTMAWVHRE